MESQQNIEQQRMDIENRIKKLQERLKSRGEKGVSSLPKQNINETGILTNNRNTLNLIPNIGANPQKLYNLRDRDIMRNSSELRVDSKKTSNHMYNQISFANTQNSKPYEQNYENALDLRRSPQKAVIRKNNNLSYEKLSSIASRSGKQFLTSKLQAERTPLNIRAEQQTKVVKKNYPTPDLYHEIKTSTMPVNNYLPSSYMTNLSANQSTQKIVQPYIRERPTLERQQLSAKSQLYQMMKLIMQGQKKLEDQIRGLKRQRQCKDKDKDTNQVTNIQPSKYAYQMYNQDSSFNKSYLDYQIRQDMSNIPNKPYQYKQTKSQQPKDNNFLQQKGTFKDTFGVTQQNNNSKNSKKTGESEIKRKSNLRQKKQNQQGGRNSIRSPYSNSALVNRYRKSASNVCEKQRKARFVQYTDQTHQQESILNQRCNIDLNKSINNKKQEVLTRDELSIENGPSLNRNGRAVSAKTKFIRVNSKRQADNFNQLLHIARMSKSANQRIKISQQCKDKIWHKVEVRMKQSQKQYFDPLKKTNKHEHQNLIGTLQLQKKLKQQLIGKIYQKCNHYMFK